MRLSDRTRYLEVREQREHLGNYRDKTVLTGSGNIFKACLMMKSKFIKYINCSKVGSILTVILMKDFLEKGAIKQSQAPIF